MNSTNTAPRLDLPLELPDETGMDQVLSDLQALKGLYGLLHKGQANENLDEASRAFLMRMLDDATRQALQKQAKMLTGPLMSPSLERKLSIRTDRRSRGGDAETRPWPMASPSLTLYDSERSRRLKLQASVRSRDGHRVHDHLIARVASNRSSRTAMPRPRPRPEESLACFGSHSSSMHTKPRSGTVNRSASSRADRRGGLHDWPRRSSGHGDESSLEQSSRRRSVSREPSSRRRERLQGRATGLLDGPSTRRFGWPDSGLSVGSRMTRRGSQRAGSVAATPRLSSSSNGEAVTIRSRITPNRELIERCLRRAEEESLSRRRGRDGDIGSGSMGWLGRRPRRMLNRIDSGSTYISSSSGTGSSSPSPCTSPTAPSTSGASASSSSSSVSRRGNARPQYASEVPSTSRSRRRCERQERREGRLGRLKNKLALVFHHRHDHHHHHHIARGRSGSKDVGRSGRHDRRANDSRSPWRYLGGMFHRTTGHEADRKTTTRTVVTVPGKQRGGHVHSLFDALVRHKRGAARAPARAGMRGTSNRVQVKKMHWWQRLRRRHGRGEVAGSSRPRRRLGHGKAV